MLREMIVSCVRVAPTPIPDVLTDVDYSDPSHR